MHQIDRIDFSTTGFLIQRVLMGAFLLFSMSSHAAPVLDEQNDINSHAGTMESLESMDARLDDGTLASVYGKGVEESHLQSGQQLAVILWDERGNSSQRTTRHDESTGWNSQSVSLTVNRQ